MEKNVDRFLAAIQAEKLKAQDRRGALISKKLGWVTGLFAAGVIKLPIAIESRVLLFFVPVVAVVYDLYILGENYGIKRMGSFVRQKLDGSLEAEWELWLCPRRDPYSRYALYLSSCVILIACLVVLLAPENPIRPWPWFASIAVIMFFLYFHSERALTKLDTEGRKPNLKLPLPTPANVTPASDAPVGPPSGPADR